MNFKILVVDDEKNIRNGLARSLEMEGYDLFMAENGTEALKELLKTEVDLIISDLKMPGMGGEALLKKVVAQYPTIPVIILTGHGTVENAVDAMRDGAYDFVTKPINLDRLSLLVKRALSKRSLVLEHQALQTEVDRLSSKARSSFIGKSGEMMRIFELIEQVANSKASILITGESGVGKELVAEEIHSKSNRREKELVRVHCAALSENLLESELFGHEKGAFTGANSARKGRFELADGGTIFLDEIGEINLSVQIKLLRVLQEKKFERVGGEKTIEVDTRVVAATNKDLKKEVEEGRFREDLYYRLNVINLNVPPLRERREDIPLLTAFYLKSLSEENERDVNAIDSKAARALFSYNWPGNVRELRNSIESAVVLCKGNVLMVEDLPPAISSSREDDIIRIKVGTSMTEAERIIIRETLEYVNNNKSQAAEVLGIGRKTLHRKLNDFGMQSDFAKKTT